MSSETYTPSHTLLPCRRLPPLFITPQVETVGGLEHCFYIGHVRGREESSSVTASTCHGGGLSGMVQVWLTDDDTKDVMTAKTEGAGGDVDGVLRHAVEEEGGVLEFMIEPVMGHHREHTSYQAMRERHSHIIYRHSDLIHADTFHCDHPTHTHDDDDHHNHTSHSDGRHDHLRSGKRELEEGLIYKWAELLMVNDLTQFKKFKEVAGKEVPPGDDAAAVKLACANAINVANKADEYYIKLGLHLRLVVSACDTWSVNESMDQWMD